MDTAASARILVGHVRGAFGLAGWVDVWPYSNEPVGLLKAKVWWHSETGEACFTVEEVKRHVDRVVAKLAGSDDRSAAEKLKGHQLWVEKSLLPPARKDEFYFVDLVDCTARLLDGSVLGVVRSVDDNGAHAVFNIEGEGPTPALYAVPFVAAYVHTVDIAAKEILIDWQRDWLA